MCFACYAITKFSQLDECIEGILILIHDTVICISRLHTNLSV